MYSRCSKADVNFIRKMLLTAKIIPTKKNKKKILTNIFKHTTLFQNSVNYFLLYI